MLFFGYASAAPAHLLHSLNMTYPPPTKHPLPQRFFILLVNCYYVYKEIKDPRSVALVRAAVYALLPPPSHSLPPPSNSSGSGPSNTSSSGAGYSDYAGDT